jgi:glycosyltransferase involved in cell wall biosynthesis
MDAVITISWQSKKDLETYLKIPGSKIIVTPLAAGTKFRVLSEAEIAPALERAGVERPYILYVGSVEPRKNLLRLLDAYQELLKWSERWRLVIVGARNYWKSSPVAQKVEQLGLGGQVKFTGYVPDEDLPALYNGADLFCFPSLYEGFGLPVLEAMACGTPVVTANSSSLPEVAGEAALLVDPYNVAEIAAAMRRVLEDPQLAEVLRQRGLKRSAQFTWEKTARETIAVYEKVLGEKLR